MYKVTITMLLILLSTQLAADVPADKRHEVEHLLSFIASSNCTIIRNGSRHPARDALAHIIKKYDYFRERIHNTEEFIAYAASTSTFSGEPYTVECPGKESMQTSRWLLDTLRDYRSSRKSS